MSARSLLPIAVGILCSLAACSRDPEVLKQRFLELGNKYQDRGKHKEASILYRKALQQDGLFAPAYHQLGLSETALGRFSTGAAAFLRAFEIDPNNIQAFRRVAEMQLAYFAQPNTPRGAIRDLIDLVERAERHNPDNFEVTRIKGLIARVQGNLEEAIQLFRKARELDPSNPEGALALTEGLLSHGDLEEAEQLAQASLKADPSLGQLCDLLYVLYLRQNKRDQAEEVLQSRIENNPSVSAYRISLAGHHLRAGNRAEMDAALEDLLSNLDQFPNAYEMVGDFHVRTGESDRAVEFYQKGRSASSDAVRTKDLTYKIVVALASDGKWEEAAAMLEELLTQDSQDPRGLSMRSAIRLRTGDQDEIREAVGDLEQLVRQAPDNAVIRFRLGQAYLAVGDTRSARIQFSESSKLQPGYALPKYELMRIHLARREFTQAVVMADELLSTQPNDPTPKMVKGIALLGLQDYEEARAELEPLVEREQFSKDASFHLARVDLRQGRIREAEARLKGLLEADPNDERAQRGLATFYAAAGRPEQATQILETRVKQAPDRLDYRIDLARFAASLGDRDRALAELQHVLSVQEDHPIANTLMGEFMLAKGQAQAAQTHFRAGAEGANPHPRALVHLGTLAAAAGDYMQARQYFEQALKLAPDNPVANNNLAYILAETNSDLGVALNHAQRAKAIAPDNPDFSDTLGLVYIKRGLHESAVSVLGEIVAKHPARVAFRYHYALALHGQGEDDKARAELETALNNEPSSLEETQIRNLLDQIGS